MIKQAFALGIFQIIPVRWFGRQPAVVADRAIVTNFDVKKREVSAIFPHAGTWYEYYAGGKAVEVGSGVLPLQLAPGGYKMYTDYPIEPQYITGLPNGLAVGLKLYPNPANSTITIEAGQGAIQYLSLTNLQGAAFRPAQVAHNQWDITTLAPGFYIVNVTVSGKSYYLKLVKR